jgi:ribose/xylose/arabinose/galactoside ABC-type transport system permease subunit
MTVTTITNAPRASAPLDDVESAGQRTRRRVGEFLRNNVSYLAFVLLVLVFWVLAGDSFMNWTNWKLILEQLPVLAILAIGMTFVITGGFIDLSVGSALGLAALVGAFGATTFGPAGLLLGVIAGASVGLLNGILFAFVKIPSFIVTLASMVGIRAVVAIASGGFAIYLDQSAGGDLGFLRTLGQFPWVVVVTAVIAVLAILLYNFSVFGRDLKAIGGNEKVVGRSGINVTRMKVLVFVLSGTLAGLASIISLAQFGAAGPQTGMGLELYAISAVVLGGTPLTGGHGSVIKTIVGALALQVLANGLTIAGVPPSWNDIVRGALLVIAIAIALDRRKIGIVK